MVAHCWSGLFVHMTHQGNTFQHMFRDVKLTLKILIWKASSWRCSGSQLVYPQVNKGILTCELDLFFTKPVLNKFGFNKHLLHSYKVPEKVLEVENLRLTCLP